MNVNQMIGQTQREISCKPENRVKKITKLADGGLKVEFGNGTIGTIGKDDPTIQAFVVWSVLYEV